MNILDLTNLDGEKTKELNIIASDSKSAYTEFVDQLSMENKNSKVWWLTPFVSREPTQCDGFYDFCLIRFALSEIQKKEYDLVIVHKKSLKRAIIRNCKKRIRIKVLINPKEIIKRCFSVIYRERTLCILKKRIEIVKKNSGRINLGVLEGNISIIDTYVIPSQFVDAKYVDRYFPGLIDNSPDRKIFFLGQLDFSQYEEGADLAKKLSTIRNIIPFETLVEDEDYNEIRNMMYTRFKIDMCVYDGIDFKDIVSDALLCGRGNITSMYGVLKGKVISRILGREDICVERVIGWYEGQASSNGLFSAIRETKPNIQTVAYLYMPCPENNIGLYPSKMQNKEKKVAEYYAVGGAAWINNIKQFDKKTKCCIAPAFRYGNIRISNGSLEGGDKVILILSGVLEIAKLQLRNALSALIDIGYSEVLIKNHPFYSKNRLDDYGIEEKYVSRINVIFKDGNLADAVRESNIAIVSETSSSLELIFNSLKVINYVPNGKLSYACVPEKFRECVAMAYSADEIKKALHYYTDNPEQFDLREMQEECFEKVSNETIRRFFEKENYK